MNDVNLSRIYTHLMRFYGISRFKVYSNLDEKGRYPLETKFDFYLDNTREVNHVRLQRVLKRNIKNVNDFFFVVQDNRIIIYVDFTNKKTILNSILNLAPINMKKTKITITHQLDKTLHHFMVVNPDKLTSSEVDRIKKGMGVEMVFVNGRLYK